MEFGRPIIVIAGPTASGKSSLALKLAKEIKGAIINADSRQIYKELNIGIAKPSPEKIENNIWYIENIPHFLYGFKSIEDSYNIYEYQKDVQKVLDKLPEDTIPILTGGTGLYIDSVVFNYQLTENTEENSKRNELENLSLSELQGLIDKEILEELNDSDRSNPVRLIRIIEKQNQMEAKKGTPLDHIYFVIDKNREVLRERISKRVDQMIEEGLVEENRSLYDKGLFENTALQKTIGYQEFNGYFEGNKSLDEVKEDIVQNTSKYAKRQRTWFRRNENCIWTDNYEDVLESSLSVIKTS